MSVDETTPRHGPIPEALAVAHQQAIKTWAPIEMLYTECGDTSGETDEERLAWLAAEKSVRERIDRGEDLAPPLVRWDPADRTFSIVHGEDVVGAVAGWSRSYDLRMMEVAVMYPDPRPTLPPLTPTQDLIVEVLTARYRAGDSLFTFSTTTRKAAEDLAAKGVIDVVHGVVPKTYRAGLTWDGMFAALHPGYQSSQELMLADRTEQIATFSRINDMHAARAARAARDAERAESLKKTFTPNVHPRKPWLRGTV